MAADLSDEDLPECYNRLMLNNVNMLLEEMRGVGRTTEMIYSLKDGDVIICANHRSATRIRLVAKSTGAEVTTIVAENFQQANERLRGISLQRCIADHEFLDKAYVDAVKSVNREWRSLLMRFVS